MNSKTVEPITSRQSGELSRLLEERGVGRQDFQKLIEFTDVLVEFMNNDFIMNRGRTSKRVTSRTTLRDVLNQPAYWNYWVGTIVHGYPARLEWPAIMFEAARNTLRQEGRFDPRREPTLIDLTSITVSDLLTKEDVTPGMVQSLQRWLAFNSLPQIPNP